MMIRYTNYTNLDTSYVRPYEPGDRLVRGWEDEIDLDEVPAGNTIVLLEHLFARHNHDDRPDGQLCPSMSVGDVVVLGESAWSVDSCGFVQVTPRVVDLITDRTWREVVRA